MPAVCFDKAIALAVIEPFYLTFRHLPGSFFECVLLFCSFGALLWSYLETGPCCSGERSIPCITQNIVLNQHATIISNQFPNAREDRIFLYGSSILKFVRGGEYEGILISFEV
jgi:hypothetical protein